MATESRRLDYWRKYFGSSNSGIFDVIEHAILVAALDCPKEFRAQRDRIAETLFSCQLARCHGCDKVSQPSSGEEEDGGFEERGRESGAAGCVEVEAKFNSSSNEGGEDVNRAASNYSYDEAEALTEEMEEEGQMVGEVLRIKKILANKEDESDALLFESLRRLQLMSLSVDTIKITEIGKAVNGLRKHSSKQIRHLVRTLIDGWKALVDEWVSATATLTENTPESVNPSVVDDEEGLPSPPLDEGVLFSTQTTMELSQFFDGMDDDGNLRNSVESDKSRAKGRKPSMESLSNSMRKQQVPHQSVISEDKDQMRKQDVLNRQARPQEALTKQAKPQELLSKQTKPQEDLHKQTRQLATLNKQSKQSDSAVAAGPGRPQRTIVENNVVGDALSRQRQGPTGIQKKPLTGLQDKSKNSDEMSVRVKLEAAKRKLHEGYQQAENAKKQRTIQVMELHDIPKQGFNHRQPFLKQGNQNRLRGNGWR
uniref:Transcription elongation factor A protein 3 n=2 Tax=Anthurium amnicola TaxID=1678845 RepID=A0A1D1YVM7_9ARAE